MIMVGAILRESVADTVRFVDWYLDQGVTRIMLCFDNPDDPALSLLKNRAGVVCTRCTPAFWRKIRVDPDTRFTKRQNAAMQFLYDQLKHGWFLNVNGDELVHLKGRTLQQEMHNQPAQVRSLLIRPAERIQSPQTPGVMQFRTAMRPWCCRKIYGDLARAMNKRSGLSGHYIGKSITRAGLSGHKMRQHFLQTPEGAPLTDVVLGPAQGAYLLHFVDHGFEIWRAKLPWRLSASGYRGEMRARLVAALEGPDPEPILRQIYRRQFVFGPAQLATLVRAGAHLAVDLQEHRDLAKHFAPDTAPPARRAA